jgi:hypothetical protein
VSALIKAGFSRCQRYSVGDNRSRVVSEVDRTPPRLPAAGNRQTTRTSTALLHVSSLLKPINPAEVPVGSRTRIKISRIILDTVTIASGPGGNLCFAEAKPDNKSGNRICQIIAAGEVLEFLVPTDGANLVEWDSVNTALRFRLYINVDYWYALCRDRSYWCPLSPWME